MQKSKKSIKLYCGYMLIMHKELWYIILDKVIIIIII